MVFMDEKNLNQMAMIFYTLSKSNRLQVLYLCQGEAILVNDLAGHVKLSQSLVSHHMKQLQDANLIQATCYGKNIHYRIEHRHIQRILKDMLSYAIASKNNGGNNNESRENSYGV